MVWPAAKPALVLNGTALIGYCDLGRELRAAGLEVVFRSIDDIAVDIGPAGVRIHETVDGRDLATFGLVHVLAYQKPMATLLNAVADYTAAKGVRTVNINGIGAPTKLFRYVRLANRGLFIPSTVYLPPRLLATAYPDLATRLDLPFVVKTVSGGKGRMTSLIGSEDTLIERLGEAEAAGVGLLAQELVPPDGSYFLLVMGGQVSLAMRYGTVDIGDVLGRSGWEQASPINPRETDPVARQTAVQAAAALEYDIAGVHLVRHWTTGQWCLLDVNPNPLVSGDGRHTADTVNAYSAYLRRRLSQPDQVDDHRS
jgi:glutathione synthase/RimK-type ligase-like ATP-grasp enzyme